ncbi:MAG: septum formation protein Maf, partial [Rhodobacteraceae bacterium]|nr:septum formation protein Maf [Paracoccaceae bacterium]
MAFILGSASPRRLQLLAQLGLHPDATCAPRIDEAPLRRELPRAYCRRMAQQKAQAIKATAADVVLCADTTVALGRRILGKPADATEAARFLRLLSGRRHRVITAVVVARGAQLWCRDVVSVVRMKRLSEQELRAYIASQEWQGKAGGYGLQGRAAAFIPWIGGSP